MKFIVSSSVILEHLSAVSRVISAKNTLPILDNFLFELNGNKLTVTASDLESTLITEIKMNEVNGSGSIAVPARLLTTTLKEFPEQPLTFEIDKKDLTVKILSDKGEFSIMGFKADEFPQLPKKDEENNIEVSMNGGTLAEGINKTLFATADDELRPVMNGIFVEFTTSELRFVASDAHKLVRYNRKDIKSETESAFILPKKPASLLKNILVKDDEKVNVEYDLKNAFFTMDNYKLVCRLVEGQYPNYASVIPENNPNHVLFDRKELYNSLKRVSVFSNPASNLIKFQLSENQVVVSAQDIDFSISAHETLPCKYEGDEIEIGFKSLFLMEILANLDTENVLLKLSDSTRAGIFEQYEKENEKEDVLMLLMPMMLNV